MKVGFTGTQRGLTKEQMSTLRLIASRIHNRALFPDGSVFNGHEINWFIHGMCWGADTEAADIFKSHGFKLIGYPGTEQQSRSQQVDILKDVKPFLARNKDIVNGSDILIACPGEFTEVLRSGTWATYRYATKIPKPIAIVFPDGNVSCNLGINSNPILSEYFKI